MKKSKVDGQFTSGEMEINNESYNNATVMVTIIFGFIRTIVQEIAKQLPPLNWGTRSDDGVKRLKRPILMLENGAKYEGEW